MRREGDPPSSETRIAVVEDDEELRERILVPALRAAGFDAIGLGSSLQLYRAWATEPFDLVLLDVGLPDDDGIEIARHLRELSPTLGIVAYTGHGQAVDRLRGLRAGFDAYLVKPLDIAEVVETLRAVRRRQDGVGTLAGAGGWSLRHNGWSLVTPSGAEVTLSQTERQILLVLVGHPNTPVDRETLITRLTSDAEGFDPHRLEMLVYRLRRKCLAATGEALPLQAVRGLGYVFAA